MKKTYKTISIVLVVLALLVIILAGCSDMMAKMGEIVITVEPSDKIRTTVTSYTVTGTLEGSKASPLSLEIVVPATEISIPSISPGKWTFVIKAFDSVGEIGEGTQVVTLSEGQNVNLNVPVDFVPIPLSISNIPFTGEELSKEYDGNTSLTFGGSDTYTVDPKALVGLRSDKGIQDSVLIEATATYRDKIAGSGKTLDIVYTLIYSEDTAIEGKYVPPVPYTINNGTITERQLTITDPSFETKDRVYDGTNSLPVTAGSLIGVVDGDEVTVTATAAYDDKNAATGKDITVTYTLSGSDAANYTEPVNNITNTGTITQKPLGFSVAAVDKTYDGYAVSSGNITLTGVLNSDTDEVGATGTFTFSDKHAGTSKIVSVTDITLTGDEKENYSLAETTASTFATIEKKVLTSAGTTILSKVYDQKVFAQIHIDNTLSGLVTVDSVDDDITLTANASYDNADVGAEKTITVHYMLSGGSDVGNYIKPDGYSVDTGEIKARQLTIDSPIFTTSIKVYDGTIAIATFTTGSPIGILVNDTVTIGATASYADKNVGTDKAITVTYTLDGTHAKNYLAPVPYTVRTGEIKPIQLTIDLPTFPSTREYDGTTTVVASAGTLSGVLPAETAIVNIQTVTATYENKNVGTGKSITVSYELGGTGASNYLVPVSSTFNTGAIKQKQLTIDAPTFPNGKDKAYDGNNTLSVSPKTPGGVVSDDWITVDAKAAYNDETIADGKTITVSYTIDGLGAGNYLAPVVDTTHGGNITKAKLLISDPILEKTKEYDGTTGCQATAGRILSGIVGTEEVRVLAAATYDGPDAGEGKTITVVYSLAGEDKEKYEVPGNYEATGGKIGKRQLSITEPSIPDPSKVYDGTDGVAFTKGVVTGLYASDGVGVEADGRYLTSKSEANKYIKVTYSLTGPDDKKANYIVPEAYWTKTGEISKRQLFVEGTTVTKEKTYDGALTAQVPSKGTLTGVTSGDSVSLETRAAYSDKNVSTVGKNIHVEYTLSGPDMANYTAPAGYDISDGVSITARQLTAGIPNFIESLSKGYDGDATLPVAVGSLSGIINDEISVSATALYTNADAAEGKSVTVTYSLSNNSGGDMRNYLVPAPHTTNAGVIKARQLTIADPTISDASRTYTGSTSFDKSRITLDQSSLSGVVLGDTVTAQVASASYDDKHVGTNKVVTVSYVLDTPNANYLAPVSYRTTTGAITKKQLGIQAAVPTAVTTTKIYDGKLIAEVTNKGALTGLINNGGVSEDVSFEARATYSDKNVSTVGKNIHVEYTLSGPDMGNYTAPAGYDISDGVSITARQLSAGIPNFTESLSKGYDGDATLPVAVGSLSGIINDEVSVSATALYASADADVNKVVTVTYELVGTEQEKANYLVPAPHKTNAGVIKARQLTIADPTISNASRTYTGSTSFDKSCITLDQSSLSGVVLGDTVTAQVASASYDDKRVDTGKTITVVYTLTGTHSANYLAPVSYRTTTGAITSLELVIGTPVHALTKSYDGTNTVDVSAGSLSGYATGDDVAIKKAVASYADKGVGTGKSITVTYELGGRDAGNYSTPTHSNANGIITAKKLSVQTGSTKIIADKILDLNSDVEVVEAGTLIGVVGDEDVTLGATASYADGAEGTGKVITVVYSLGGAHNANYEAPANNNTSFKGKIVNPQLRIGAPSLVKAKIYNNSADVIALPSNDVQGIVGSDDVQVVVSSAYYNNKHAGEGKTITVEYALTGTDRGKYSAPDTYQTNDGLIEKKLLVIDTPVITDKEYDGTKDVYFSYAGGATAYFASLVAPGKYAGDEVILNINAEYMSSDIATGKFVLYNYVWSGSDAGNYSLPKADFTRTAVIAKKALRVQDNTTSIVQEKTYDGNLSAVTTTPGILVGLVSGSEDVALTTNATFVTKSAATGKDLHVTYSISGSDADTYDAPASYTTSTGVIYKKALEIEAPTFSGGMNRVYDNTVVLSGVNPGSLTNKVDGDDVTISATASYESANAGDRAITVTYTIDGADASNYIKPDDTTGLTGTISKKLLAFSPGTLFEMEYWGWRSLHTSLLPVTGIVDSDKDLISILAYCEFDNINAGVDKPVAISQITIRKSTGPDKTGNYEFSGPTATGIATITPKPLTLSATQDYSKTYDGTLTATGSALSLKGIVKGISGLLDDVSATGTFTFSGVDVGAYNNVRVSDITLSGDKAGNYSIEPTGTTTASISKATHDMSGITFNGASHTYNGKTHPLAISGDLPSGVSVSYSNNESINAGTHEVTASFVVTGNYIPISDMKATLTINQAVIDMSGVKYNDERVTYDGNPHKLSINGTLPAGASADQEGKTDAGTHDITINFSASDSVNYLVSPTSTHATLIIDPKFIRIEETYGKKTYDGTTNGVGTLAIKAGELVPGDEVTVSGTFVFVSADANVLGETTPITITNINLGGTGKDNYKLLTTSYGSRYRIYPRELTLAQNQDSIKTYDGTLTTTGSVLSLQGIIGMDDVSATGTCTFSSADVGNYNGVGVTGIVLTGTKAANYSIASTGTTTASISPKALEATGTLIDPIKIYDGNKNATISTIGTLVSGGVVSPDNVTLLVTAEYASKNVYEAHENITVTYALDGRDAGNYTAPDAYTLHTGVINKKVLTVSGTTIDDKVYDGTTTAFVSSKGTLQSVVSPDDVSIDTAIATYNTKDTGTDNRITVSYTLKGAHSGNYLKPVDKELTGTISKKPLTIARQTLSTGKAYDGDTTAAITNVVLDGIVSGEDVSINTAIATYNSKDTDTANKITTRYTLKGDDIGNYLKPVDKEIAGTISQKQLTITSQALTTSKVYDGNTTAAITDVVLGGIVSDEDVSINTVTATYNTKDTGTANRITVSYTLTGAHSGNYSKPTNYITVGTISQKQLTVSGTQIASYKVYDGNKTAEVIANGTLNGVIGDDIVTVIATANYLDLVASSTPKPITVEYSISGRDESNYIKPSANTTDFSGTIEVPVGSPIFTPSPGTYTSNQNISLSSSTDGATIRYTTDGSVPSLSNGTIYSAPFSISDDSTIKAIAYKIGYISSNVQSAAYYIRPLGEVTGIVTDTISGLGLGGVSISIEGLPGYSTTTASNGSFSIMIPSGGRYIQFSKTGYTIPRKFVSVGAYLVHAIPQSEIIANENVLYGQLRMVLTWGETPSDLDFYLKTPNSGIVYFGNKEVGGANLDVDDTSAYGPETITITSAQSGTYKCYVHKFSDIGNLGSSNAVVRVFDSTGLVETYTVPNGSGDYWNVFTYTDGRIESVNRIVDSAP